MEPLEIGTAMDQEFDMVAGRVRETARMSRVDLGRGVPSFVGTEEPSFDHVVRHRRSLPSVLSGRGGASSVPRARTGVHFRLLDDPSHHVFGDVLLVALLSFFRCATSTRAACQADQ